MEIVLKLNSLSHAYKHIYQRSLIFFSVYALRARLMASSSFFSLVLLFFARLFSLSLSLVVVYHIYIYIYIHRKKKLILSRSNFDRKKNLKNGMINIIEDFIHLIIKPKWKIEKHVVLLRISLPECVSCKRNYPEDKHEFSTDSRKYC
jgi:hypothetical protein